LNYLPGTLRLDTAELSTFHTQLLEWCLMIKLLAKNFVFRNTWERKDSSLGHLFWLNICICTMKEYKYSIAYIISRTVPAFFIVILSAHCCNFKVLTGGQNGGSGDRCWWTFEPSWSSGNNFHTPLFSHSHSIPNYIVTLSLLGKCNMANFNFQA
jgi:hypothetical protein